MQARDDTAGHVCSICGDATARIWGEGPHEALRCRGCGTVATPSERDFEFGPDYYRHYLGNPGAVRKRVRHFGDLLSKLPRPLEPPVLDVGAGLGFFARALDPELRAGLTLLEPSSAARAELRRLDGIRVVSGFHSPEVSGSLFRSVTLWDVLAHVPDPKDILRLARERMVAGGLLVIKTPYHPSRLFRVARMLSPLGRSRSLLHVPSMRFHFTPASLAELLERSGFESERSLWVAEPPLAREGVAAAKGVVLRVAKRFITGRASFIALARSP